MKISRPPLPPKREHRGSFDPGPNRIVIQYRNFQGEDVEFEADGTSIRLKKDYLSACVVPTGRRIVLAKKFTRNLKELEQTAEVVVPKLTPAERQIVGYHRKRGTTSARYEEILQKHPELR